MEAGRAYDEIAVRYAKRKQSGAPAAWSKSLMLRWVSSLPLAGGVLDLGCGHGVGVAGMVERGLRPVGLDLSFGMLTLARQHLVGWLVQADAARLPLHTAILDGVWSLHALLHVTDLTAA